MSAALPFANLAEYADSAESPGRFCPLAYLYSASGFNRPPELHTGTLYVVGGLYGNPFALDAIEALFAQEPGPKRMVFNGDFHWFDVDAAVFADIDERVQRHIALRGNVETELASDGADVGCGCAYPGHVSDADVARSNAILLRLKQTAMQHPTRRQLGSLPMHLVAQVGAARIAVVHGDAESLAGWRFDPAALDSSANQLWLDTVFEQAQVDIFASSHTCAPALRQWPDRAVINNGAAGMGHAPGCTYGTITRISPHKAPIYAKVVQQTQLRGVQVQAIRIDFDNAAWQRHFLQCWPPGSAAYTSYWHRVAGAAH